MSTLNDAPQMAPQPTDRTYTFTAKCASGQWKTFTFQKPDFRSARTELETLIKNN